MRSGMGGDGYRQVLTSLAVAAEEHDHGGQVQYLPAVAAEGEAAMAGRNCLPYGTSRGASASWQNSVTRASIRELLTVQQHDGC